MYGANKFLAPLSRTYLVLSNRVITLFAQFGLYEISVNKFLAPLPRTYLVLSSRVITLFAQFGLYEILVNKYFMWHKS